MKTLKEFDYDLWAIEENGKKRYFARVKATGEETEIDIKVMRVLLSQEKQMRREYARQQADGTILSLDAICDSGETDESAWMIDSDTDTESEVIAKSTYSDFAKMLTPHQAEIFNSCMVGELSIREYARLHGVDHKSVHETVEAIRKKFKKYFS